MVMRISEILALVSFAILFYCYLGYGILVLLISVFRNIFRDQKKTGDPEWLPVTLIISAYNECSVIESKIKNTLALDYPEHLLQILFVTDGSSDGSHLILQSYPRIRVLHQPERQGKYAAICRAMREVNTPVVVFSDCNAMLSAASIRLMIRHYADPRTGGVAGEKKVLENTGSGIGAAEGLYWRYESWHKKRDADLFTVVGAAGELFSIRTALFRPYSKPVILDDFITSMQVCFQGYRMAYEHGAFATEPPSFNLREETKRKVRIAAGAYQAIGLLGHGLHIFKQPVLSFQYISRRLLRWVLCPPMLIIFFFSSLFGALSVPSLFNHIILFVQIIFYAAAAIGWFLAGRGKPTGLFTVPFYFVFMNYCLSRGFVRFLMGKQTVMWERSTREMIG